MGTNYYAICNKCAVQIGIGKKGPSGFSLWIGEKTNMEILRKMLETCGWDHLYALGIINEHDSRHDSFFDLEPQEPDKETIEKLKQAREKIDAFKKSQRLT